MRASAAEVIAQLDDLLDRYRALPEKSGDMGRFRHDPTLSVRMLAAIERFSPPDSPYLRAGRRSLETDKAAQTLQALRDDYESGYLSTIVELIHADLFSDMLAAAGHLLAEGSKDPAAVMAGANPLSLTRKGGKHFRMASHATTLVTSSCCRTSPRVDQILDSHSTSTNV